MIYFTSTHYPVLVIELRTPGLLEKLCTTELCLSSLSSLTLSLSSHISQNPALENLETVFLQSTVVVHEWRVVSHAVRDTSPTLSFAFCSSLTTRALHQLQG